MTVQLRQNAEKLAFHAAAVAAPDVIAKGGIARGTIILTASGEVAVEALKTGDRIITRERGMAVLTSVITHTAPACTIRTDSLGLGRPERDTTVASDQHVAVRDWRAEALFGKKTALVAAERLIDGEYIRDMGKGVMTVYELIFDTDHIIYAGGLEISAKADQPLATAC